MEDFNLTNAETEILTVLIRTGIPLSVKDIINLGISITRYYIYEVLARLSDMKLVIIHGNKPKKYSSNKGLVIEYANNLQKDYVNKLENLNSKDESVVLDAFGFNQLERKIFELLQVKELNIPQIIQKLSPFLKKNSINYTSLVERYLKILYNGGYLKRFRKSRPLKYFYYARPVNELKVELEQRLIQLRQEREDRIQTFLDSLKTSESELSVLGLSVAEFFGRIPKDYIKSFFDNLPVEVTKIYEKDLKVLRNAFLD